MKDILHDIVVSKGQRINQQIAQGQAEQLQAQYEAAASEGRLPKTYSMRQSLAQSSSGIIAEFKRRSPSKGWINQSAQAHRVPLSYAQAGAAALSVLTDEDFFGGTLDDLRTARTSLETAQLRTPLLRKDFVLDPLQLLEARLAGASAVLLIAACLSLESCAALTDRAHQLGLEVLLEVHDEAELPYTALPVDMVGVNNRHLGTFVTSVDNSIRLLPQLPTDKLLVSESGIDAPSIVARLRQEGFKGFLMGEHFMRQAQPGPALARFISDLSEL